MFRDHPIRVLFDTGASHSFISKELVDTFSLDVLCLMTSLRITNPIGGSATISLLCKDVEIILCDFPFLADLHVMRYLGFGIDFCKDWLNRCEAHILFVPCGLFIFDIFNLLSRFLLIFKIQFPAWSRLYIL